MNDALGDRMKGYEKRESAKALAFLPVVARLDGRGFGKVTKGMDRPFDKNFVTCMKETTQYLVEKTGANVGYTQSDEITLVWRNGEGDSVFFDGKFQKMTSILAAMASVEFNNHFVRLFFERSLDMAELPMFDCRVFQVPTVTEAVNCLVWREIDATKNSVQMLARCHYSHSALHKLGRADQMDLLMSNGINWNDQPTHFKRGTYFARRQMEIPFSTDEISKLPEKHEARKNPNMKILRTKVVELDFPPITKVLHAANNLLHGIEQVEMKVFPTCAAAHAVKSQNVEAMNKAFDSIKKRKKKFSDKLPTCVNIPEHWLKNEA